MTAADHVTSESKGSKLRLKVPNHDTAIQATRDQLFHVVVECNRCHRVLMPPERPFQCGILRLHKKHIGGFQACSQYMKYFTLKLTCPISAASCETMLPSTASNCAVEAIKLKFARRSEGRNNKVNLALWRRCWQSCT